MAYNNYSEYFTSLQYNPYTIIPQQRIVKQEPPMVYSTPVQSTNDFNFSDFAQMLYSSLPFFINNFLVQQQPQYRQQAQQDESTKQQQPIEKSQTSQKYNESLRKIDIEDLLKQEGITSVNGKKIKFGNKNLRPANAPYGAKNSYHKKRDPDTGNAMARDISIIGSRGKDVIKDYTELRRMLLSNKRVVDWMKAKGWGIINEVTPEILKQTRGTGPHLHAGQDTKAVRTWAAWIRDPNIPITKSL